VGIDHVLHAVGNDVATRQGVQHAIVSHGNAVVNGNGVEFGGKTTQLFDFRLDQLPHIVQVSVPGHKLSERIDHGDDGFAKLPIGHAVGLPKSPGTSHSTALGAGCAT